VNYRILAVVLSVVLLSLCMAVEKQPEKVPVKKSVTASVKKPTTAPHKKSPHIPCKDCNVIWITIDALRADHMGLYGYPRNTTPNIDEFAKKSVIFRYSFTQWPKTTQSMASFLTGRYPRETGVINEIQRVSDRNVFISEILQSRGYLTAAINTNGNVGSTANFNQGFDEFYDIWRPNRIYHRYSADVVTSNAVLPWLEINKSQRFFLRVHYIDPHNPYHPKPPYNKVFVDDEYYGTEYMPPKTSKFTVNKSANYLISQYDGEIALADNEVGKVLRYLADSGLFNKSIVIISADHGESLDEHGLYFQHGRDLYSPCLRVPLILYHPKLQHKIIEQPVGLINIAPTILDVLGENISKTQFSEKSLIPLINGDVNDLGGVFSEDGRFYSVVHGEYKLILNRKTHQKTLLKYTEDPEELHPITDAEMTGRLLKEIKVHKKRQRFTKAKAEPLEMDKELKAHLKSLGYLN